MISNRRQFIKTAGAGCAGLTFGLTGILPGCKPTAQPGEIIVDTTYGKLKGALVDDVGVFMGVPYAGPSEGINRFLPPTPLSPWKGIRDAINVEPVRSYQPPYSPPNQPEINTENCQTINIWAPTIKSGEKVPVMLWNHGGGYSNGAGTEPLFYGKEMATAGKIVLISITHRLGPFGFLYLGHLDGKYEKSGNAGILDIVAALQWIRDNISEFGGDPDNVTIFGQSGGGGKVSNLLAMPVATGLFHKAIIQSGATIRSTTKENAIKSSDALFDALGIEKGDIDTLLDVPPQTIIDKYVEYNNLPETTTRIGFGPVVDGVVLPDHPFDPSAPAISANVPLIIGTNKEEFQSDITDETEIMNAIRNVAGDKTNLLVNKYKECYPDYSLADIYNVFLADSRMRLNSIKVAERKLEYSAPVFMYLFNFGIIPEGGTIPRSAHSRELAFVFNHPEWTPGVELEITDEIIRLGNNMSGAWTTFAHTGDPSHPGIGKWLPYNTAERPTMIFDLECKLVNDPAGEIRKILSTL